MFNVSPRSLTEIASLVPAIHDLPPRAAVPGARQYLIKSHSAFTSTTPYGDYRRVIYLIRDPRDVILSYHRFAAVQYNYKGDLLAFATDLACGRIWPGSWQEHVNSWLGPRSNTPAFKLAILRYEDFTEDPIEASTKLAELLGVQASRQRIANVVADTDADAMRRREAVGNVGARPGLKDIGTAVSGGWKQNFAGEQAKAIEVFEKLAGKTMSQFGYPPATGDLGTA